MESSKGLLSLLSFEKHSVVRTERKQQRIDASAMYDVPVELPDDDEIHAVLMQEAPRKETAVS